MGRLVPVKLRPDQYIIPMRDIAMPRERKVKVIRSKDIIKYIKVKKEKRERVRPLSPPFCKFVDETKTNADEDKDGKNDPDHIVDDVQSNPFGGGIEFTESNTAPVEVESHLLKMKRVDVIVKKLKFPLKGSYVGNDFKDIEDDTSKDSSLGLILTDSKNELISSPLKDIHFNLVKDLPNRKRAVLLKSTRRHENCKYSFSKFELQHNTLNLDKYFISMRRKRYRKRRPFKEINLMKNAGGELKFKAIGLPPENTLDISGDC